MKISLLTFSLSFLLLSASFLALAQSDLEGKVELIFLYQPVPGETYDRKAKIEQLGSGKEVRAILLRMLTKYKNSEPGSKEYLLLAGATSMLGEMNEKQSAALLSQMLLEQKVHENIRALATRSLGQIDPEGNKQVLLKVLANKEDYFVIRVYAAEALGKTKDLEALKALEKHSSEEKDPHVKQVFEKARNELKAKLQQPR